MRHSLALLAFALVCSIGLGIALRPSDQAMHPELLKILDPKGEKASSLDKIAATIILEDKLLRIHRPSTKWDRFVAKALFWRNDDRNIFYFGRMDAPYLKGRSVFVSDRLDEKKLLPFALMTPGSGTESKRQWIRVGTFNPRTRQMTLKAGRRPLRFARGEMTESCG